MHVAITGIGAVSALGVGVSALRDGLVAGRDGLAPIARFSTEGYRTHFGGMVPGFDRALTVSEDAGTLDAIEGLLVEFASLAMREALAEARLDVAAMDARRVGVVLGTCVGVGFRRFDAVVERLAAMFGARGPCAVATNACAASTLAMGIGRDWLEAGHVDVVIAVGADVLLPEIFSGFHAVGVLSATKCAPFSEPMGTTLGEGAGAVVLERADHARRRGVAGVATLLGYGLSADAWHETAPDPSGAGIARAVQGALDDARVGVEVVDYVNAHGTGTAHNDIAEVRALRSVLGERVDAIPVSATKSVIGHAQGAAGVLETIATLIAMREGAIPPTLGPGVPRAGAPRDPVFGSTLREHTTRVALSTSAGFGGANTVVAIAGPTWPGDVGVVEKDVFLCGVASADGAQLAALERELLADPRGLDPAALYLSVATRRALNDAQIKVSGALRDRAGMVMAMTRVSPSTLAAYTASADERGLARVSATAFPRMVLNAAAGTAAKLVGLRGALATLTCGGGSGLFAIATAAQLLATREDVDVLVAAGVDERAADEDEAFADGAEAVVLGRAGHVRVAAVAVAGADGLADAVARVGRAEIAIDGGGEAAGAGVAAMARAYQLIVRGEVASVVVTARGGCMAVAIRVIDAGAGGRHAER